MLVAFKILKNYLDSGNPKQLDELAKMCEEGRKHLQTPKESLKNAAKAARMIFDSYVGAGFNEVQAFELLKLVLTAKR